MTDVDVTVALPADETPGELTKAYYTLMRAFGWDLYVHCHFALRDTHGPDWFPARIRDLKASRSTHWKPNQRFDPQDPGVILRDYIHEVDSPYRAVLGGGPQTLAAARKILATRNTWFHFGDDPTLAQLREAAQVVRSFVVSNGLRITRRVDALIQRLDDLHTGRYPAPSVEAQSSSSPGQEHPSEPRGRRETDDEALAAPTDLVRPSIGGTWLGPIPSLRYRLTRAGDVVHPETLESIRVRVHGDFSEKVRAWAAVEPRGRELWIAEDGAVGGYIGATPRLLGWLGPDPEGEIARGFFTAHYYTVDGGEIIDLDTGARLESPLAERVADGTTLRVTTYGDVLAFGGEGNFEQVATVAVDDWFPGHLH